MEIIRAEHLSKLYYFGNSAPYSVRELITGLIRGSRGESSKRELWALRDVSFAAGDGERLGIIGNNGAGKSTLLKILSRITKPTSGTAEIRGRVGSLLEVGTGFHQELSGRENIFLNGAILGMKHWEIEKKFDEIVAFSELEKFLDTPVKHYSSGMYMKLAFAVAAHLEPEVLIVDEVLAVGDVAFQKKCLRKMRDVGEAGRTVIFVSHDMQSIARLCSRVIWIKDGSIRADGETNHVISEYLHEQSRTGSERLWADLSAAPGNDIARLTRVRVCDESGKTISTSDIRRPVGIEMTYEVLAAGRVLVPNFQFHNEQGTCIFVSHDWDGGWRERPREVGVYTSTAWVPGNYLSEGTIFVTVSAVTHAPFNEHFVERDAVVFNISDSLERDSARGDAAGPIPGVVRPKLNWTTVVRRKHRSDASAESE